MTTITANQTRYITNLLAERAEMAHVVTPREMIVEQGVRYLDSAISNARRNFVPMPVELAECLPVAVESIDRSNRSQVVAEAAEVYADRWFARREADAARIDEMAARMSDLTMDEASELITILKRNN